MMLDADWDAIWERIPFYKAHPYMKPFIGKDYESPRHKRLLLIGSNHYMPPTSTVHHDATGWYKSPVLTEEEKAWCDTCATRFNDQPFQNRTRDGINAAVGATAGLSEVAFVNYFLRPTDKPPATLDNLWWHDGDGRKLDCEMAIRNFRDVIELLDEMSSKPDLFVFLGKRICAETERWHQKIFREVFWDWTARLGVKYCFVYDPSRGQWWNHAMPDKYWDANVSGKCRCSGRKAKDFFIAYLKSHWMLDGGNV